MPKILNNQQMENQPKQKLSQISRDEVDVINDIRELNFGRINIVIQDGVIMNKEITKVVRSGKNRNRGNGGQNISGNKSVDASDNRYSDEEGAY